MLSSWWLLTDTVQGLLLLYLDHCPPFTHETAASLALEECLRTNPEVSLEPFFSAFVGYHMSPPAARLRACLAGTPLGAFPTFRIPPLLKHTYAFESILTPLPPSLNP